MCDICKKNYGIIEIKLTDKNGTKKYCPNCLCKLAQEELSLENNDDYICEITKTKGAVLYETTQERYILRNDIMLRLICRKLTPTEYYSLVETHGDDAYMLHEDFYDPSSGFAFQPI